MSSGVWRRSMLLWLGSGALALAATVGILAWIHRIDWFVIRPLWRRALELEALRQTAPNDAAFRPTEWHDLSPFDVLLSRLVRAQDPAFVGFRDASIHKLRAWDGGTIFVVAGEPLPGGAFDEAPHVGDPEVIRFPRFWRVSALGADGKLLGFPEWPPREGPGTVMIGPSEREVLAFDCYSGCQHGTTSKICKALFAVDSRGLVSLGLVPPGPRTLELCWAPSCTTERGASGACDPGEIERLIRSGREGDAHRALSRLQDAPTILAELALPLLDSSDGFLRARAVAVVGRHGLSRRKLERFAADPDPRVRIAAICPLSEAVERRPIIENLARDADSTVASCARSRLNRIDELEPRPKAAALPAGE